MALTLAEATAHISHAIGGPLVGIQNQRILDEAGRKLHSLRSWNFAKRASTTLVLTTSQAYVTLPADFGEIQSVTYTSSAINAVQLTTVSEIQRMRSVALVNPYGVFAAVSFAIDADGIPVLRLEVYPTPTATGSLTIAYRAKWPDLSVADESFIPVPEYCEALYIRLVRAYAWGYQNEDWSRMNVADELATAARFDESMQPSYGPLRNGMAEEDYTTENTVLWAVPNAPGM